MLDAALLGTITLEKGICAVDKRMLAHACDCVGRCVIDRFPLPQCCHRVDVHWSLGISLTLACLLARCLLAVAAVFL